MSLSTLAASAFSVWSVCGWKSLFAHPRVESSLLKDGRNYFQRLIPCSILQRECIFCLLGCWLFARSFMEMPLENLGMVFGCLFLISPDDLHSLWFMLHNSQLTLAYHPWSYILWANGPLACVCVLPWADINLLKELWTLPLLQSGVEGHWEAACLTLPCLSRRCSFLNSRPADFYTNSLIKNAYSKRSLFGIHDFIMFFIIQDKKNGGKDKFLFICVCLRFLKMEMVWGLLILGTFLLVLKEFLSKCWNLLPEI